MHFDTDEPLGLLLGKLDEDTANELKVSGEGKLCGCAKRLMCFGAYQQFGGQHCWRTHAVFASIADSMPPTDPSAYNLFQYNEHIYSFHARLSGACACSHNV